MSQSRQLAVIMFTDIVGYTALMGKDEQKAVGLLKQNRQIQRPLIEQHNGKWLKEMGDGILASFNTVSDSVYCALEIQRKFKKETGFLLRIGIHLGEVLFEKGDVFGDGVNIASRLQTIAPEGEILVSESVYRNIANKKGLEVEFLREEMLKNVDTSIKIYRVKLDSRVESGPDQFLHQPTHSSRTYTTRRKKLAGIMLGLALLLAAGIFFYPRIFNKKEARAVQSDTLTEKKSIAVLPFKDISPDKDQEYLGDGIAEEIRNVLKYMMKDLKVIGRNSSFYYKDSASRIIGERLNVKSILEGSIQKLENQIQFTVSLIKAEDESIIWSKPYDRELKDIRSIQVEIAAEVGKELELTLGNDNLSSESKTVNPQAWEMVQKGNFHFNKGPEGFLKAIEYHKKAIAIDSTYAYPHIRLAWALYQMTVSAGAYPSKIGLAMARKEIEKALGLELTVSDKLSAHKTLAYIYLWGYDWKNAQAEYEKALSINPKGDDFHAYYQSLVLGNKAEAVSIMKKVSEENPVDVLNLRDLAINQYLARQFADARKTCDKILELNSSFSEAYRINGMIFSAENKPDSALGNYKKAGELKNPWAPILTIITLPLIGKTEDARRQFSIFDTVKSVYVSPTAKALIYYSLGDAGKAFEWLDRSYIEKDFLLAFLKVDPLWDPLRSDPRFKKLMKKMNFPN